MTAISPTGHAANKHRPKVETDLMWGAQAIADFLRVECGVETMTRAKTYQWAARKKIPFAKLKGQLFASRSAIKQYLADKLAAASAPTPPLRRPIRHRR